MFCVKKNEKCEAEWGLSVPLSDEDEQTPKSVERKNGRSSMCYVQNHK